LFIDNGTQYHEEYQVFKQLFFANHSNVENSNIDRNMKKKKNQSNNEKYHYES